MGTRGWKLVAADESTVLAKSFFDPFVVEDGEGNRCLSDSSCPDKGDGFKAFSEFDDLLD